MEILTHATTWMNLEGIMGMDRSQGHKGKDVRFHLYKGPRKWTHRKRPWCQERLKSGGEGDDTGWDGWMASPTRWTWVWASSERWWRTGKPGMLQSKGSQRVRQDWATEQQTPRMSKFTETERGRVVARGWRGYWLVGTELQFCKIKRFLEMDSGDGYTMMWIYLMPWDGTLKNG